MGSSSRKHKKRSREGEDENSSSDEATSNSEEETERRKPKYKKKHRKHSSSSSSNKKHKKQRERSPSPEASRDMKKSSSKRRKHSSRKESKDDDDDDDGGGDGGDMNLSRLAESAEERAARKAAKEAKKMASMFGYTSQSNPFGDSNLHQQFVWKAKNDKDKVKVVGDKKKKAAAGKEAREEEEGGGGGGGGGKVSEAERRLELVREIEKVRKRREEREKEQEEMDRLKAEEARMREAASFGDWERKEEEFHLEQARVRSKIRLIEGREKPIDILAKNILLFGEGADEDAGDEGRGGVIKYKGKTSLDMSHLDVELREPYLIFHGLQLDQLQELQQDIRDYLGLEAHSPNKEFWHALAMVAKDELARASSALYSSRGVHHAVSQEVEGMLGGKGVGELGSLKEEIKRKLERGGKDVDVDYWSKVLDEMEVYQARAFLREQHQGMLLKQLEKLEAKRAELAALKKERVVMTRKTRGKVGEEEEEGEEEGEEDGERREAPAPEPVDTGYDDSSAALALVSSERSKGLAADETTLDKDAEVVVVLGEEGGEVGGKMTYWWQDKYRPRKPRYFNRVKTGWDWNMYNRTHYDHDNPPPKTVQGYKFNVFYPDLIDKTKTPSFFLERCDNPDFTIIRFHAGPPYEDVAFKILNKEWEKSHKRGFKCLFERGILSLYFNFKRARYRR